MGQYYDWVNITRKEYLNPCDFDYGNKRLETAVVGNAVLLAVYELINTDWNGDELVFLGDETNIDEREDNPTMKKLHQDRMIWGEPGYDADYVTETYRNISGLFKAAEKEVRNEIEFILSEYRQKREVLNEYGINFGSPYKGLFKREGRSFRFVINDSKREYYEIEKLPKKTYAKGMETITYQLDPLPVLFAYGHSGERLDGLWIGDKICVDNERPPLDYMDVSDVYIIG